MTHTKHTEKKIIHPDSDTVVVFIHGILGTPWHFKDFEKCIPESWSMCNILLKGHGSGVEDFSNATMNDWKKQVTEEIGILSKKFKRIFLVAHSMGCLFSLRMSKLFPNSIKGLFFLAPPLKITLKLPIIFTSIKIIFELKSFDVRVHAAKEAYSIASEKNLLHYIPWIPNFLSLLMESIKMRKYALKLNIPCQIYLSQKDELVLKSSAKYFKNNAHTSIHILKKSQHFYYDDTDYSFLLQEFKSFCNKYTYC